MYLTMKYSKNLVGDGCLFGGVERMRRPSMRMPRTGGGVMVSTAVLLRGYVTIVGRAHTPIAEKHSIVCNT